MNETGSPIIKSIRRFKKYSWDILGIFLIAVAFIIFFAFLGLTTGSWISPITIGIRRLFGWGSLFIIAGLLVLGVYFVEKKSTQPFGINLKHILLLEGAVFLGLVLLSIISGGDIASVQAGKDLGGMIGWGLSDILLIVVGPTLRLILVIGFFTIFLLVGSGGDHLLARWVDARARRAAENPPAPKPAFRAVQAPPKVEHPVQLPPLPHIPFERDTRLPPLDLLSEDVVTTLDPQKIQATGSAIEKSLAEFGIPARVTGYRIGPTVTQYAVEPGFIEKENQDGSIQRQKIRISQISALGRDLALALSAERIRIEAPVPGHSYVGIEIPNPNATVVRLRSILEAGVFNPTNTPLMFALGRDVSGQPVAADLSRMPHLLIAGTTGSGKSVCIVALATCLVMNNTPEDLRLIMVDPKMVELIRFNGLPHLMGKVETDLERILAALRWTMGEMDNRYRLLEQMKVRDIAGYNAKMERKKQPKMPRIVLIIDELADLMLSAPDQTEEILVRLAQLARAVGIHLVVATQRPSTDVITGLIKANFPARIAFAVASSIDSRVILDTNGAETLLGKGDMLFLNPESGSPLRSQGIFVSDHELEQVLAFWRKPAGGEPEKPPLAPWEELVNSEEAGSDDLIKKAITVVRSERRASASLLQRRLRVGYPRAARLIDELEEMGIIGPSQGGGREREVIDMGEDEDAEEDKSEGEESAPFDEN